MTCRICREGAGAVCTECATRIASIERGEVAHYIARDAVDVRSVWPTYISGAVAVSLDGKDRSITLDDAHHIAQYMLDERVTLQ